MYLVHFYYQQESPPAWTQEAYCPPCSKYSLCCPNWVTPPPVLTWLGGYPAGGTQVGTPLGRVPPHPDLARGYLPGYPPGRVPPSRVPPGRVPPHRVPPRQGTPQLDLAGYPPGPDRVPPRLPHGILGNVAKHYGIWVPPLWTDRQTRVKTLPSRRTTYAGGNNCPESVRWYRHRKSQRRQLNTKCELNSGHCRGIFDCNSILASVRNSETLITKTRSMISIRFCVPCKEQVYVVV